MTDTIDDVAAKQQDRSRSSRRFDEQSVAEQLVAQAREKGIELVGPDGLLSQLTKRVLETALEAEMTRSSRLRQARPGRPQPRQLPQRGAVQDGADRDRPGRDRGAS